MALFENFSGTYNDFYRARSNRKVAQTFTAQSAHTVSSVKLNLFKDAGGSSTGTVEIQTTDGSGIRVAKSNSYK